MSEVKKADYILMVPTFLSLLHHLSHHMS